MARRHIYSTQLFGTIYNVFRTDRSHLNSHKSRGGGVLIAVLSKYNSFIDPAPISAALEQLWAIVQIDQCIISVGVIYLPPDRKNDSSMIHKHIDSITSISSRLNHRTPALLFGDYKQSGLHWCFPDNGIPYVDVLKSYIPQACCALLDGFSLHHLTQINCLVNRNERLLDLALVNDWILFSASISAPVEPLIDIDADHPPIEVTVNLTSPIVFEQPSMDCFKDFRRADYAALCAVLKDTDWQFIESASCIDDAVSFFCDEIYRAVSAVVPVRRPPNKPPWSNSRLRELKRLRSAALRKFCNHRSPHLKRLFSTASAKYRKYNLSLYNGYVRHLQEKLRRSPKQFWSFVNSKRKEDGLPSSMFLEDKKANNEMEKCNLFAEHFRQIFNSVSASQEQIIVAISDTPRDLLDFAFPTISQQMVISALQKLKLSFSVGPDGIPSAVLKRCAEALSIPLMNLFNLSLQKAEFPVRWKFSYLFPVFKKGDKRNVANYRGITSLSACSKLFEIIVNDLLFSCCKDYIDSDQHGFYPKRSVTTNLVQFISHCLRSMDSSLQIDVVYTDLKAAFDRVDHGILLEKLSRLGVPSSCVTWFRSYLTNRCVCVKIGSSESESFSNVSGVPQGSNLGPLLFSIFLNDVSLVLPSGCRLFYADDTKLFRVIKSSVDCQELQSMLDTFVDWCSRNYLDLSIEKCSVISYHRKTAPIVHDYFITGCRLQRVQNIRDLGVTLDRELTFRIHYDNIIRKAERQLGFIFKIANEFRDPFCLKSLYCSLVRSLLETNAVAWCPFHAYWIARFEAVQRRFIRYALRFLPWRDPTNLPPYVDRCRLLAIEPLEHRRAVAQAVFAAKILTGAIDCPALLAEFNFYAPERSLRQRNFLYLEPRHRLYGLREPIRSSCERFNEFFSLYDFNVSYSTFRQRLLDIVRITRH